MQKFPAVHFPVCEWEYRNTKNGNLGELSFSGFQGKITFSIVQSLNDAVLIIDNLSHQC